MKVHQYRGKRPLEEIEHIKSLLGDLFHGYHAYDPQHTNEDTTIVLTPASQNLRQWWEQTADILTKDGYEVERYG